MERCWLLTWTTYGSWLPGDARGSVTRLRDGTSPSGSRLEHDAPETPYAEATLGLVFSSLEHMKGDAVLLDREQAEVAARQMEASARYRGWWLLAGSIMANHVHLVVGVPGDPKPSELLKTLKSYASRALNERWPRPASGTWWTSSGSTRKLIDDTSIDTATMYVRDQDFVLARCDRVIPEEDSTNRTRGTDVPRSPEDR